SIGRNKRPSKRIPRTMPEVLALIPARGGSKSLPRKNVLPLGGIPLIAHTIRAAQAAKCVSRVAVSTEDSEIAEIARQYGADVVKRPMELATDDSTSESALLHSLDYLEANEGYLPDILCFLQCTSPFTAPEDIRSEEHTSELQSRENLVCRLLLEKKKQDLQPDRQRADR